MQPELKLNTIDTIMSFVARINIKTAPKRFKASTKASRKFLEIAFKNLKLIIEDACRFGIVSTKT